MNVRIVAKGLEVDAWLEEFIRTTVAFATWHHDERPEQIHVVVDRAETRGSTRCAIRASLPSRRMMFARATGSDASAAIQEAADRLEVALCHGASRSTPWIPDQIAA